MATNGLLYGNNVDGSEGSYFEWQLAGQNQEGNYSIVNWQVGWRFSTTSCRGLRLGNSVVNGVTVYNDADGGDGVHAFSSAHEHRPRLQTAAGTINIFHNSDGSKQFSASVRMTGFAGLLSQGSTIWSLPTINQLPNAPAKPTFSDIRQTSITLSTESNGDGGSPIIGYQWGYGTTSAANSTTATGAPPKLITGLIPGTKYYFRVRAQNSLGFGPWSAISNTNTLAGARVNQNGVWKRAIPYVKVAGVWKVATPWVKVAGVWKEAI